MNIRVNYKMIFDTTQCIDVSQNKFSHIIDHSSWIVGNTRTSANISIIDTNQTAIS